MAIPKNMFVHRTMAVDIEQMTNFHFNSRFRANSWWGPPFTWFQFFLFYFFNDAKEYTTPCKSGALNNSMTSWTCHLRANPKSLTNCTTCASCDPSVISFFEFFFFFVIARWLVIDEYSFDGSLPDFNLTDPFLISIWSLIRIKCGETYIG